MKILLLGEFSGLHLYLKEGLLELGHDVVLLANGDGSKQIPGADALLFNNDRSNGFLKWRYNLTIDPLLHMNQYDGYDVVQCISPLMFSSTINTRMLHKIKKRVDKFFALVAGDGYYGYLAWRNGLLSPSFFDDNLELQRQYSGDTYKSKKIIKSFIEGYSLVDGIIPCIPYQYVQPYRDFANLKETILFPINTKKIEYKENVVKGKIVFFHGITRQLDKGSSYIIEAMNKVAEKYPNDVECISVTNLPFNEYQEVMSRTNVVIDQCKSYGYGINGCIAMAQGKVMMTSVKNEMIEEGNLQDCPAISITPSVEDIVEKMKYVIENRNNIQDMGHSGRQYIEKHHNYIQQAQKYEDCWNSEEGR